MKYKVLKWLILIFVLFYYVLNIPPPEWVSNAFDKFDLFAQSGSVASFLVTAFALLFVILIFGIASMPVLIALLGAEAKKRRDYLYGSIIIISCICSVWEIWINKAFLYIFILIFSPFSAF
jgi:hypothetical protein